MKKRQLTQILGGAAIAALALSACGTPTGSTPTASESPDTETQPTESTVDQEALLQIQDKLSAELGQSFVQGWIQDGQMHVATTDESSTGQIEAAGAVPTVVEFNAQQLREGIAQIMNWQAQQDDPIRTAIHGYELNGKEGGLILRVDPGHIDEVKALLDEAQPAGQIPLSFAPSTGIASPAAG
ncbi:hypothetical protein OK351_12130 [Glutamicibacter sp. MNS18]|uniref:hypothetical protein n=1 Tax=Glutamicibacter sp. MNS18 TaxID=2989817 RepID=UPI002235A6AE|nr:hypothetical protein [Glutamicibacter sp. MNS18]MCW4466246.1 hypothetical protein [Glutamicibacter sp. MNS18]